MALVFITMGAAGYVMTDKGFQVDAYMWVGVWFVVFAVDVVYIKYIVDTVPMTSWGRVYYQVCTPHLREREERGREGRHVLPSHPLSSLFDIRTHVVYTTPATL